MADKVMVAVTGANGFVGKNLCVRLSELEDFEHIALTRDTSAEEYFAAVAQCDVVVHLAGVNRPSKPEEFSGNADAANMLADAIGQAGRNIPIIYTSSTKAEDDTPYGRTKKEAEDRFLQDAQEDGVSALIMRLPNIFGKWCRPNYNSAVATFCHNIARDMEIAVNDPAAQLSLLYVDDLVDQIVMIIREGNIETGYHEVVNVYDTTVGDIAQLIKKFHDERKQCSIENVGTGLTRALYATYISYLPAKEFSYELVSHGDPRGSFSEVVRTPHAGQFSYFNAHPGVTRGGHYHHTKTEKFLVVHGRALFKFRHILTDETHEIETSSDTPVVVDTIPGWSHDITNIGNDIMVCLLWANELFDRERPDTIAAEV